MAAPSVQKEEVAKKSRPHISWSSQQWKNQVGQVARWTRSKFNGMFAQCAMMIQAMSLKGCVEHESNEIVEQDIGNSFA